MKGLEEGRTKGHHSSPGRHDGDFDWGKVLVMEKITLK